MLKLEQYLDMNNLKKSKFNCKYIEEILKNNSYLNSKINYKDRIFNNNYYESKIKEQKNLKDLILVEFPKYTKVQEVVNSLEKNILIEHLRKDPNNDEDLIQEVLKNMESEGFIRDDEKLKRDGYEFFTKGEFENRKIFEKFSGTLSLLVSFVSCLGNALLECIVKKKAVENLH